MVTIPLPVNEQSPRKGAQFMGPTSGTSEWVRSVLMTHWLAVKEYILAQLT